MVNRHWVKELSAKNSVTRPMKYIVIHYCSAHNTTLIYSYMHACALMPFLPLIFPFLPQPLSINFLPASKPPMHVHLISPHHKHAHSNQQLYYIHILCMAPFHFLPSTHLGRSVQNDALSHLSSSYQAHYITTRTSPPFLNCTHFIYTRAMKLN